jgi:hypothetical protein
MHKLMRRCRLALALWIAPLVLSSGCGDASNTIWVTGNLLKGGAKYEAPADQLVGVTFVALEVKDQAGKTVGTNEPYQADYDPADGSFSVAGKEGKGIPPGRYRIAVTQKMKREAFDAANPKPKRKGPNRETDTLNNKFGLDTSPITREIPKSTSLEIDLDKPAGP